VRFEESLVDYLLNIVHKTRDYDGFRVGVSTRAALSFYRGCQACAVTDGRDYVTPDDIKLLVVPALSHRVLPEGFVHGSTRNAVEQQIVDLLNEVPVPI
jgi:MoxR-like ATPase